MRTFEIRLASGEIVTIQAGDAWEATCLAVARYGKRVVSFRWIPNS